MSQLNTTTKHKPILVILFSIFLIAAAFFHNLSYQPWIYLSVLTIGLALVCLVQKTVYLPPKNYLKFVGFAFGVFALSSLLNGSNLLEERWIMRYIFATLAFTLIQLFKTESDTVDLIQWPITGFILYSSFQSIYQYLTLYNPNSVLSHSVHAASFWNISHYSQSMLVALPCLLLFHKYSSEKIKSLYYVMIVVISTSILLGITRITWLALSIFFTIELIRPFTLKRKTTVILIGASLVGYLGLSTFANGTWNTNYTTIDAQYKSGSVNQRKNLIKKAINMGIDNPTGVGVNNFPFGAFAYLNDVEYKDGPIDEIAPSPHSEPLRILAEEGLGVFLIYVGTLLFLIGLAIKKVFFEKSTNLFFRFLLCLVPEIIFHFPSELYFSTFLFTVYAATYLPKVELAKPSLKKGSLITALVLTTLTTTIWFIRNEKTLPKESGETFCSIFHDDWRICRRYFSDFYIEGNFQKANDIARPVLKYQPYNFYFLMLDYSLGSEPRSSLEACLYYNLFEGKLSIPNADISKCTLEKDRVKVREAFTEFADKR